MRWIAPVSFLFLTAVGSGYGIAEGSDAPPKVALCEVLAHPADYSGKAMTMTARITATKEGSFLWSPSCRNLGLTLQIEDQAKSDTGIQRLLEMLRQHGLSDHPVTATLTGVFLYNQQDEYRNRRRSVFRVSAASEIKQADAKPGAPRFAPFFGRQLGMEREWDAFVSRYH